MREGARARLWISGRVQAVGYRLFAARAAQRWGVSGFVRNLPDGRVEAAAEGPRDAVEGFVAEMRRGPAGARVSAVQVRWEVPAGDARFDVEPR